MHQAVDHRQQQRAARGGDEARLRHARQRLGLAVAEAVIRVGRDQGLADGEEGDQRAHQVERRCRPATTACSTEFGDQPRRRSWRRSATIATAIEARLASRIRRRARSRVGAQGYRVRVDHGAPGDGAAVFQPVVQAERAVLPELDQQRLQAEARPVRRPRHLADDVPGA